MKSVEPEGTFRIYYYDRYRDSLDEIINIVNYLRDHDLSIPQFHRFEFVIDVINNLSIIQHRMNALVPFKMQEFKLQDK